jgi:Mannosylglycerate hydrolase MGH1-like glycoside hydrolase domain
MNQEELRLLEAREKHVPWRKWGPYLSERQWGTVREDYSENGNAWDYFTHEMARSRAYRWGEDGIAGFSDEKQRLCFSVALWNGVDPILKERLFGLTNAEGNHGEDVKEYYFYLDSTPTHSYMKYLYKYPQSAYPYGSIVQTNKELTRNDPEYELLDTGVFNQDRYFDVFVEYAKESPEDILIQITIWNRGPELAMLHLLPTLWFRNTWSWQENTLRPLLELTKQAGGTVLQAMHPEMGEYFLYGERNVPFLFTENETNAERIWGTPNRMRYVKDGINDYLIHAKLDAINPDPTGTKASAHHQLQIKPGESQSIRLRLSTLNPTRLKNENPIGVNFEGILKLRKKEADDFFASITPSTLSDDEGKVMRQAIAGMLWSKQYYFFDVDHWLEEHGAHPLLTVKPSNIRNLNWFHMVNDDVISMPDKWEYPWYAAWDLAFHTISLAMVDLDFAKHQLDLMLRELYLHPSGQIPAYEWNFGDVNPPVHAWATLYVYNTEKQLRGKGDITFLKHAFQKLLMNFTWWVNRKDPSGKNVFEGGFLGLDNIGVFDRSAPLPTGGYLEQADGTAWMAFFAQNMLDIALELARYDDIYEDMALKFLEHFLWIAAAMDRIGDNQDEMWDEEDGFFYDLLRFPNGTATRLKVRSMVGLLPLCAVSVFEGGNRFPKFNERVRRFVKLHPQLLANITPPGRPGVQGRHILSILDEKKLRRVLIRMLDENEFLSPHGIRALSQYHAEHPFVFNVHGEEYRVDYLPAESNTGMFGGNSNWRGPVWFPVNALIFRSLLVHYSYYGNEFTMECPTGSGKQMNLFQIASDLANRLNSIFLRDKNGRRPVYGGNEKFQTDPYWRDHILFHEYFHGDNGAGLGASHQTGWTGLVARLIQFRGWKSGDHMLKEGARSILNFPC